jgi:hypothetical protein
MGSWLEDYDYYTSPDAGYEDHSNITWTQKTCFHDWKATQLIISTVYDCKKCNVKKEEYDKWASNQDPF